MSEAFRCPQCGSDRLYRDGLRYLINGNTTQRWLCRNCGYRFSQPNCNSSEVMQRLSRIHTQSLNCSYNLSLIRQRSDEPLRQASTGAKLVKNLAAAESQKQAAGMSPPLDQESIKGKILEFLWKLEKDGRTQGTIRNYNKWFSRCLKHDVNIFDPEEVKGYLAKAALRERTKITIVGMLRVWYRFLKIHWEPPEYIPEAEIPFIPTEQELDQLIAGCGKKTSTYLQLMKETGARAGEISKLTWADIDFQQRIVRIKPEKGSLPRMLPLTLKATEMLNNIPKTSDRIFLFADDMRSCFYVQRKRIARKLGNPRLLHISFHTFRHWKGTMEYHKTKDILHVMRLLGHKNINNTLIYTQLVSFSDNDYVSRVAKDVKELCQLVEAGFEYVTDMDGVKILRKRK